MNDVTDVVLLFVIPVLAMIALVFLARSPRWAADHPNAGRNLGIVGGGLGLAVAAYWAGRFLGVW